MTYIFPERKKIDRAQFILDRSRLVLEAEHTYSFHTKHFEILTNFSDSMAEKV